MRKLKRNFVLFVIVLLAGFFLMSGDSVYEAPQAQNKGIVTPQNTQQDPANVVKTPAKPAQSADDVEEYEDAPAAGKPVVGKTPSLKFPRKGKMTIALAGDGILTRRVMQFNTSADPRFSGLVNSIKQADAAIINLEESLIRFSDFKGWPEAENGGNWEVAPPEMANELVAMGFNMMARANNHTTDYGVEGMKETNRVLDRLGIPHAGSGENLGEASHPAYLDTSHGRVALISLTTSFSPMSRAGNSRPDMVGRPGCNAVRLRKIIEVDEKTFEALRQIFPIFSRSEIPKPDVTLLRMPAEGGNPPALIKKSNRVFAVEEVYKNDQDRIVHEIINASRLADYVVVNIHGHQPGNFSVKPPEFMKEMTKAFIDAGADVVAIHGPHQLRGIEIYKGKPILYSLGNLFLQTETIDPEPNDRYESLNLGPEALSSDYLQYKKHEEKGFPSSEKWYESILAIPIFENGQPTELRLIPLELGHKTPITQRGTARLAEGDKAKSILERLQELSAPFGTKFAIKGNIGVWQP
jgi:poly-gamma-glutamate capsule biosynthesis protein CapA/YwtB (metallophosphatase superfamily)